MTSAYPDIHREILSDGNYRGEALHRVLRCCYDNLSGEIVLPCTVIMDYITPANSIEELVFVSRSDISRFKGFRLFRQKSSSNYYHFFKAFAAAGYSGAAFAGDRCEQDHHSGPRLHWIRNSGVGIPCFGQKENRITSWLLQGAQNVTLLFLCVRSNPNYGSL